MCAIYICTSHGVSIKSNVIPPFGWYAHSELPQRELNLPHERSCSDCTWSCTAAAPEAPEDGTTSRAPTRSSSEMKGYSHDLFQHMTQRRRLLRGHRVNARSSRDGYASAATAMPLGRNSTRSPMREAEPRPGTPRQLTRLAAGKEANTLPRPFLAHRGRFRNQI